MKEFRVWKETNGTSSKKYRIKEDDMEKFVTLKITKSPRGLSDIFEDLEGMRLGESKSYISDKDQDKSLPMVDSLLQGVDAKSLNTMFGKIDNFQKSMPHIFIKRVV